MAEVYVAQRELPGGALGPLVAVKRLMAHHRKNVTVIRMFLNEARITAQIHHPNVVRILDLGQSNGEPYIAMELLEGHSLAEIRLREAEQARRLPLAFTLRIIADASRGLNAAHRAVDDAGQPLNIVHRDFSPENIHVGLDGQSKVLDFGIARAERLSMGTDPGTLRGKFFYMSPEMVAGEGLDHRADVYAAGAMIYEALCGRRPFTGRNAEQVLDRIAEGKPKPPRAHDPSVPESVERICLRALQRKPADRFSSLLELAEALEALPPDAKPFTPEEVGSHLATLIPAEGDPRREILRRARASEVAPQAPPETPIAPSPEPTVEPLGPSATPPWNRHWRFAAAILLGLGAMGSGLLFLMRL